MSIDCKHLRKHYLKANTFDRVKHIPLWLCALKTRSDEDMRKVFDTLSERGLEFDEVSSECPIKQNNRWADCPYRRTQ